MRIAYIGHAYHEKTGSTRFLIDLLEQHATVERWSGEPGTDPKRGWGATFDETRYDAIVVFQLPEAFDLLSGRHPNVVFVPMYDAIFWGGNLQWRRAFNTTKIACFSWALSRNVARHTQTYANFQYLPDPDRCAPVEDFATLRGLLWYRKREISPALVFDLCQGTAFERFVLHDWPDPRAAQILQRVAAAASPASRVLVIENVRPAAGTSLLLAYLDVQMLAAWEGRERTLDEYRALFRGAGLTPLDARAVDRRGLTVMSSRHDNGCRQPADGR